MNYGDIFIQIMMFSLKKVEDLRARERERERKKRTRNSVPDIELKFEYAHWNSKFKWNLPYCPRMHCPNNCFDFRQILSVKISQHILECFIVINIRIIKAHGVNSNKMFISSANWKKIDDFGEFRIFWLSKNRKEKLEYGCNVWQFFKSF